MTRARLASVVLAILLVTVAAIGQRLSDPDSDYQLLRAPLDQATPYDGGEVRVSDVRVASTITDGDDRYETQGLFVVLNVAVRATGRDGVGAQNSRLLAQGGVTYLPAFALGAGVRADPGFETSRDVVYEVDPDRIADLTLELWDSGLVYRYYQRTQTPLGITAANAGRWAAAGAGQTLPVPSGDVTTALS